MALFGSGIGNATSLPPLVAQVEFVQQDQQRVIAAIVAVAQATYAFAPATFGLVLTVFADGAPQIGRGASAFFAAVALVQLLAIGCFLAGRKGRAASGASDRVRKPRRL